jgi:ERCC4-type nuclease
MIIDTKELAKHKGEAKLLNATESPLELGDYIIQGETKNYIIEHKTLADLFLSFESGNRLIDQLKGLSNSRELSYTPIIAITGQYMFDVILKKPVSFSTYLARHPNKETEYNSILFTISAFHIPILWFPDVPHLYKFLVYLESKVGQAREKKEYPERGGFRKDMTLDERRLYVLEAFGFETAKAILTKYGSLSAFLKENLNKSKEDSIKEIAELKTKAKTIGTKKAEQIWEVLFS